MRVGLTLKENHRTDSDYNNSLIAKNFLFKFINSYNSLFYLAFFRQFEGAEDLQCTDATDCLIDVRDQLIILFLLAILLNNFLELYIP